MQRPPRGATRRAHWAGISRRGLRALILTCGPARGSYLTTLPDAAGRRAAENPASCELPAEADSQRVVSICTIRVGSRGATPADSEPAKPGGGLREAGSD